MTAHRYRASWRSLTFNQMLDDSGVVDDPSGAHINDAYRRSDYRLERLDMNRVEATDYRELRQWLEGGEANEAYEGVMVLNGTGVIYGTSHADLEDRDAAMREAFSIAACRKAFAANDPPGVGTLLFKRDTAAAPGYLALQIYARPMTGRPIVVSKMREGLARRFTFFLVAFDPRIYSQTLQSVTATVGGSTNITNGGNLYTSPKIVMVSTGAGVLALSVNGTAVFAATGIPAGTWTLDAQRGLFTKADGTNGMQYRTSGYLSNCTLDPGTNVVSLVGSSGFSGVTFQYRNAYA